MLEILEFIFRDFFTWLGALIMLVVIAEAVSGFINRVTKK